MSHINDPKLCELMSAIRADDAPLIRELYAEGTDMEELYCEANGRFYRPFHVAVDSNNMNACKCLVKECGVDINDPVNYQAVLHYFATKIPPESLGGSMVECLIEACGADLSIQDEHGYSALHTAIYDKEASTSTLALIEYLVKHGCPANAIDCDGLTALDFMLLHNREPNALITFLRALKIKERRYAVLMSIKRSLKQPKSTQRTAFLELLANTSEDVERLILGFVGEGDALVTRAMVARAKEDHSRQDWTDERSTKEYQRATEVLERKYLRELESNAKARAPRNAASVKKAAALEEAMEAQERAMPHLRIQRLEEERTAERTTELGGGILGEPEVGKPTCCVVS
jgi:hypothetical protein